MTERYQGPPRRRRGARGALALLALLLALLGGLNATSAAARHEPPLDLAAMALTPPDLAAEGLDGYGANQGRWLTPDQAVDWLAGAGFTTRRARALVEDTGLTGVYVGRVALASEPGDGGSIPTSGVMSYLYAFEEADGAAEFFDAWTEVTTDEGIEEIEGDETIGDESRLLRWTFEVPENDAPGVEVGLNFRAGRIYAEVGVFDAALPGEDDDPVEPAVGEVEALGERLLDRIEAVLDGEAPGLGLHVLRLETDDPFATNNADRYAALDGEVFLHYGDSPDDEDPHAVAYEAAGVTDAYTFEQVFPAGGEVAHESLGYLTRLHLFEDEDDAAAWLEEGALAEIGDHPAVSDFEELGEIDDLGDGAVAASVTVGSGASATSGHVVAVVVDAVLALILMDSADGVDLDVVLDLAETQVDCLEDAAGCLEPSPLPEEVLED